MSSELLNASIGQRPIDFVNTAIAKAGGIFAFCRALGVSHQAVYSWKKCGWVPIERAVEIERLYGVPAGRLVKPSISRAFSAISASSALGRFGE